MVEDYEDRLQRRSDHEARRDPLDRIAEHDAEDEHDWEEGPSGYTEASQVDEEGTPCVRTLEGHSKSVTALYYEDGCLVSASFVQLAPVFARALLVRTAYFCVLHRFVATIIIPPKSRQDHYQDYTGAPTATDNAQVTGSSDKTIRQWDVATGQCLLTMDILWAISNPPPAPPGPPKPPRLAHRSSTSFGSVQYDDLLPSSPAASSLMGMTGAQLLAAATSQNFAVPTPPFADGSWEMYQDFVGGLQFWGYALASGSGDGGVRMWDSECGARPQGPIPDERGREAGREVDELTDRLSAYWSGS
jgi:division protein 1